MKTFEVKVKYIKESEDGSLKRVTELYLVDGVTVSDAETKIVEEMEKRSRGELVVLSVKEVNHAEIVIGDSDYYFQSDVESLIQNPDTGKESTEKLSNVINAADIDDALSQTKSLYEGTMMNTNIVGVKRTKIVDVIKD